ncbi:MAG: polysaccharide pyruvyl transferase CsaB [Clostridia bacterium]|nr:polysaccharide pyruvyl transferase CsaB [Clostridia bacterium]
MKVLHLTGGGDIGGAKTHVVSLVKNLGKHIDVKLVSFRPGAFAEEAQDMGINTEIIRTGNIFTDIKHVVSLIRKENYQIIHSHGAKANMIAVLAKMFTRLPVVTTVHSDYKLDYMHSAVRRYSFGIINTVALRFIDYYTCVSKNIKETLIERKFMPSKLFTIPNGIDFDNQPVVCSREEFVGKFGLPVGKDDVLVGILARLTPVKGVKIFIQAAKEVIEKNSNIKFLIAGDGDERKALEQMVTSEGLTGNIFFLGYIKESFNFLNAIDINVLSSVSEGFPYSILEGALLKKATVSSRVGGIPDLIDSGENGFLFAPGDYLKLSEYIVELSRNTAKRREIGERIYVKAKDIFSMSSMCKTQLRIYDTISRTKQAKNSYDVILSGYYGFKNSGDDAILMAIINNLKTYKDDVKIVVLSKSPVETGKHNNVDSINRLNLYKALSIMKRSKLFINGGGNLMQDGTSTRSLLYYLGVTWLAKKMGAKVMVYANGIGPINKSINKILTRSVLNQVDVITLREDLSMQELENLRVSKPRIVVTADPALTVEAAPKNEVDAILESEGIKETGPFIGFSARIIESNITYDEAIIAKAADYTVEKYSAVPLFIPMQPIDLVVLESIVSKMKYKGYIIRGRYEVNDIIGIISRMEMLVGMRLHSLIYAANLGIPVVGLVYDTKVEGFLEYFHQASAGHVQDLSFERLTAVMNEVWGNKESIRNTLYAVTSQLKEKAFENARIAVDLIESTPDR